MNPVPYPILAADPHEGIPPHLYLIIHRQQRCVCCGATHEWSELYAQTFLRANWGHGKPVTNLRKLDQPPRYNIPIKTQHTTVVEIPFCHKCYYPTLAHTPGMLELPVFDETSHILGSSLKAQAQAQVEPKPKAQRSRETAKRPHLSSAKLAELLK